MTEEELNTELYVKMFDEQERFRGELLGMTPEEVLDHAYEYCMREDILLALEYNDLSARHCAALLKSGTPLADVFGKWEKHEGSHLREVFEVMESHANSVIREDFVRSHRDAR